MRTALLAATTAAVLAATASVSAVDFPIRTQRVVTGVAWPTAVVFAPGDSTHMYILEKAGRIRVFDLSTNTLQTLPFLDLTGPVLGGGSQNDEQGLLGLAFDPNYQTNGFFYVNYTGDSGGGDSYVVRYQAQSPTSADPTSNLTVITYDQPFANHNGGWLGFGHDGYLYISTGDGGSANDPGARAQDITDQKLGKMLRLDITGDDFPADLLKNYKIPSSNPFVGVSGDDEIYLYGLRNPWRCSFDRLTGDLWIGDVGQGAWEEIDFIPASTGGQNLGWRCMEGNACTGLTGCTCNGPTLTDPVHAYGHNATGGISVTGGFVYRGCAIPEAYGHYFFVDYSSNRYWSIRLVGGVAVDFTVQTADFSPSVDGFVANTIVAWGQDHDGELYIVDHGNSTTTGQIFRVIRDPNAPAVADCNLNGESDFCDILADAALDCDLNGALDSCQIAADAALDCNVNGALDSCEIAADAALDCDLNGALDACQIAADAALDCNVNGALDSCEIAADAALDCDLNGALDSCQIGADAALDCNINGVLDSCEGFDQPGDLNGDCVVDGADLGVMLSQWGRCDACPSDINGDGVVDGADLGILLIDWSA